MYKCISISILELIITFPDDMCLVSLILALAFRAVGSKDLLIPLTTRPCVNIRYFKRAATLLYFILITLDIMYSWRVQPRYILNLTRSLVECGLSSVCMLISTLFIVGAFCISFLLFRYPALYFINHNYIFAFSVKMFQ